MAHGVKLENLTLDTLETEKHITTMEFVRFLNTTTQK